MALLQVFRQFQLTTEQWPDQANPASTTIASFTSGLTHSSDWKGYDIVVSAAAVLPYSCIYNDFLDNLINDMLVVFL